MRAGGDLGASIEAAAGATPAAEMAERNGAPPTSGPDAQSRAWLTALAADGARGEDARRRLHDLLLRAARFEIKRRRGALPHLRGGDLDDLAHQAADDAMLAILGKLDSYRGDSRFTTWAYKFALLEAGVKLRRRAWQDREVPLEPDRWPLLADGRPSPSQDAEVREVLSLVQAGIEEDLTPHQREVFTALALNGVPIDVLAERLGTTRGALYKTLHDARRKLRARLERAGLSPESTEADQ